MNAKCRARIHRWDNGSKVGSRCLDCGKEYGVYGPRKGTQPPARSSEYLPPTANPRPAINERLRERWGLGGTTPAAPPATAAPAPPPEAKAAEESKKKARIDIGARIKDGLPDALISVPEWIVEKSGRIPNEVDPDLRNDLQECTDLILEEKLPKLEVNPWVGLLLTMGLITVNVAWKAQKKPVKPPAASTPRSVPASTDPNSTGPFPKSSSPQTTLSLVEDAGSAEDAAPSASDE